MWKKKLREYKGKFENYSIRKKLNSERKINSNFETILNSLTLEEIIGLKLELSSEYINNRLYNINIWKSTYYICREAVLKYALSSCRSIRDAASLMGISESSFRKEIKKFKINLTSDS